MNTRLMRLAQKATGYAEFIMAIKQWPHWYLPTERERRLTRSDFEKFYKSVRGN